MQWPVINMLIPCIRASRSILDHFFIINACSSQCGQRSHCLALSAYYIQEELITFSKLNATPPYGCNCYIVNCLPLPKSQALETHTPCNNSSVFYLSWEPANPHRAPFTICIDLHPSTAEPICRPSLEFLVSFNDQETCHWEWTQLQNIHVKLKGIHPAHLEGHKSD